VSRTNRGFHAGASFHIAYYSEAGDTNIEASIERSYFSSRKTSKPHLLTFDYFVKHELQRRGTLTPHNATGVNVSKPLAMAPTPEKSVSKMATKHFLELSQTIQAFSCNY
jgi:hypothetical protein